MYFATKKPLVHDLSLYPCPVVLVTSSFRKKINIITISWIGIICSHPPLIGIGIKPSRYSHSLISDDREFTINVPSSKYVREVDFCGSISGRFIDKFSKTGFTPLKGDVVSAPLISECPVNLECKVENIARGIGGHDLFIGKIVRKHIDANIEIEEVKNYFNLDPIVYVRPYYFTLKKEIIGHYGFTKGELNDSSSKDALKRRP